jgi:enterochelin esterase-like enzyme
MAFDIALVRPDVFLWAGVFSGSFWWRSKGYQDGYTDADRIMHKRLNDKAISAEQHFWIQTGTNDEKNDRDKDGIIDAIGDALDIIAVLETKGHPTEHITYLEVEEGEHNQHTWRAVMGNFLTWLWV